MPGGQGRSRKSSTSSSGSDQRSRSRRRSSGRSRHRGDRHERSQSPSDRLNNLNITENPVGDREDPVEQEEGGGENQKALLKRMLSKHSDTIAQLLAEQKEDLYDRVETTSAEKHKFRQKAIEKQFEVNEKFMKSAKRIKLSLKKGRISKARSVVEELVDQLEEHSEDLIGADISRHGWLSVSRARNRSSLPKDFLKELERVDTSIDKTKRVSSFGSSNGRFIPGSKSMDTPTYSNSFVRTSRAPFQKKSPEVLLEEATKQTRAGQCGHCQEEGHFYRECPRFWEKVKESRLSNLKK